MKLIIDIHEKDYQSMLNGYISYGLLDAIKNGTPLDDIKAEIEDLPFNHYLNKKGILKIIDKYIGKESE